MNQPHILFYVQHLLGIGHLARASRIATALKDRGARVTMVTGGLPVAGFPPEGVEHIALPPVQTAGEGFKGLADAYGQPVGEDFLNHRRDLLLSAFRDLTPDVVVTEAFPFGRRQMRFELLPLLEAIGQANPRPRLYCSVRDILQAQTKPGRDQETLDLVRDHFDGVLVHGDPGFVRLEDTFPLADQIADRVTYTGLVAPARPEPADQGFDIVVSAGGGAVGEGVSRAALAALDHLPPGLRLCLITGPNLPDPARAALQPIADARPQGQVTIERFRRDFPALLAASNLSVSQAGYNTVCDILQAGCRSVLIPYAAGGETEQTTRAEHLAVMGRAQVVTEDALSGETLARAITAALADPQTPPESGQNRDQNPGLNLDGARISADILCTAAARI